jgi:hypothetical protein
MNKSRKSPSFRSNLLPLRRNHRRQCISHYSLTSGNVDGELLDNTK